MLKYIYIKKKLIAIIIRRYFKSSGIKFFTPSSSFQQLGYMKRPKDYVILPHVHNPVERVVSYTQEVLFIKEGKLKVDFYTNDQIYLHSRELNKGDVILLMTGGHGFEVLEDLKMFEVKQGPYAGDQDKTRFIAQKY